MPMKKSAPLFFLGLIWLILAASPARAVVPPPPEVAAQSYLLTDLHSGKVLIDHDVDRRLPPASLTKIMTVYVVFHELAQGNLQLDDWVTVSEKAWRAPGSRMFIEVGKKIPVEKLLKGVIIQSGNDASIALAEHIAGDETTFAELMNQYARRLGMENTHYVNSTGLPDPEHYTTAKDLAILTRALISQFPQYYGWFKIKEYTFNHITQHNRNLLLWRDATVDGVKTGHTENAGYCLVSSAQRDQMRLISVVMDTASEKARADASQALFNYGFRFFVTKKLYEADKPLKQIRIYKGAQQQLPVGLVRPVYVTVPKGKEDELNTIVAPDPWVTAPMKSGEHLGKVMVRLGEKTLLESPLVAMQDIEPAGFAGRLMDEAWLLIDQWWAKR